jgi:hypothetical protein
MTLERKTIFIGKYFSTLSKHIFLSGASQLVSGSFKTFSEARNDGPTNMGLGTDLN